MDKARMLAKLKKEQYRIQPGQPFRVSVFDPRDAEAVARLFYQLYGDAYPVDSVYSPMDLIKEHRSRNLYRVVSRTPAGDIVGLVAFYRTGPFPGIYKVGRPVVLPEYKHGMSVMRMIEYGVDELALDISCEGLLTEATGEETYIHKIHDHFGFYEMALSPEILPDRRPDHERRSVWTSFRFYRDIPQTIYVPTHADKFLRFLYGAFLTLNREFTPAPAVLPRNVRTKAQISKFDVSGICGAVVERIGSDFGKFAARLDKQVKETPDTVAQVYLNLTDPGVGAAVEELRAHGFIMCGILPRWFDQDALLMQKNNVEPDFAAIRPTTARGKKLIELISANWHRVNSR